MKFDGSQPVGRTGNGGYLYARYAKLVTHGSRCYVYVVDNGIISMV